MIRKFIYRLLVIVIPVGLIVCLTNYFVDPANVYSSHDYVDGIADILSKGHNVDNTSNYDERSLQEQMIKKLHATPDVIVVGSSRIMEVGSDFFKDKAVLNCGVSHANIHDIIALTGLLDSLGRLPRKIIMNVDPGLISIKSTLEWQNLAAWHDHLLRDIPGGEKYFSNKYPSNNTNRALSLVSFDYFKASLNFLFKGSKKQYTDVNLQRPLAGRFADGTICYGANYTHPDTIAVATNARLTAIKEGLSAPDSNNIFLLNALLDFLQKKGVEVKMLMLPFHHSYYVTVNEHQHDLFKDYESFYRQIGRKRNIAITGSFDADRFGLKESHFYDMYHCSSEAIHKVVENL